MDDVQISLARYRYEKSNEFLESSRKTFEMKFYNSTVLLSYHSLIFIIKTVFALEGIEDYDEQNLIKLFKVKFLANVRLSSNVQTIIDEVTDIWLKILNENYFIVTREEALNVLNLMEKLLEIIIKYIQSEYNIDFDKFNRPDY